MKQTNVDYSPFFCTFAVSKNFKQMKNLRLLFATLLIGGMMLAGCERQDPEPTPTPDPTPTSSYVTYKVDNKQGNLVLSDCFKLNVTYTDAEGQSVTENGVTVPWTKTIEVTTPFHAEMQGEFVYNEAELPETVVFGKRYGIGISSNGSGSMEMHGTLMSGSKESFLNLMAEHPDRLQFTYEKDF